MLVGEAQNREDRTQEIVHESFKLVGKAASLGMMILGNAAYAMSFSPHGIALTGLVGAAGGAYIGITRGVPRLLREAQPRVEERSAEEETSGPPTPESHTRTIEQSERFCLERYINPSKQVVEILDGIHEGVDKRIVLKDVGPLVERFAESTDRAIVLRCFCNYVDPQIRREMFTHFQHMLDLARQRGMDAHVLATGMFMEAKEIQHLIPKELLRSTFEYAARQQHYQETFDLITDFLITQPEHKVLIKQALDNAIEQNIIQGSHMNVSRLWRELDLAWV